MYINWDSCYDHYCKSWGSELATALFCISGRNIPVFKLTLTLSSFSWYYSVPNLNNTFQKITWNQIICFLPQCWTFNNFPINFVYKNSRFFCGQNSVKSTYSLVDDFTKYSSNESKFLVFSTLCTHRWKQNLRIDDVWALTSSSWLILAQSLFAL